MLSSSARGLLEGWQYWRPSIDGTVELGTVLGQAVALPAHFHEEDQVTFVLRGRRYFVIDGRTVSVPAGESFHIPAGEPHSSLSGPSDVIGINVYTAPGVYNIADVVVAIADYWRIRRCIDWGELSVVIAACRCGIAPVHCHALGNCDDWGTIGEAARVAGMSREGYSRRFSRLYGMPPQAFQLTERLNLARRLLRSHERIAAVAADTGFADQSHLGRCFRRVFGITPGRYRANSPVTSVL